MGILAKLGTALGLADDIYRQSYEVRVQQSLIDTFGIDTRYPRGSDDEKAYRKALAAATSSQLNEDEAVLFLAVVYYWLMFEAGALAEALALKKKIQFQGLMGAAQGRVRRRKWEAICQQLFAEP